MNISPKMTDRSTIAVKSFSHKLHVDELREEAKIDATPEQIDAPS